MRSNRSFNFAMVAAMAVAMPIAGCADSRNPVAPTLMTPTSASSSAGATRHHEESEFDIDGYFSFPCLEEPIHLVVFAKTVAEWVTTPTGISSVRSYFDIDRSKTYTVYKGVTYYVAQGRPGHDDIGHILEGPDGLYVTNFVEPDFESSATGERLNIQFVGVTVIGKDGTVRVEQFTGQCPAQSVP